MNASIPAPALTVISDAVFSWGSYFEALAWLCFALALLWFVLWLIKRRGGIHLPGSVPAMRIESRMALGPKKWIMVVLVQDRRLLLGVTDQRISLLCDLPAEAAEPAEKDLPRTFAAALDREGNKPGGRP
ncbi:MAG: flagellar biosynthetic protein FliO [Desulfovibrio sp.]|jgi:flagellar protein FliO/FliZ|nr:flagellar biosynthetic protein FliO [Desulfovibrio sp.]